MLYKLYSKQHNNLSSFVYTIIITEDFYDYLDSTILDKIGFSLSIYLLNTSHYYA